jgi:hypothetical protein
MPTFLLGDCRDGVVTLREKPRNVPDGSVRVLPVPERATSSAPRMLEFGKCRGRRMSPPRPLRRRLLR